MSSTSNNWTTKMPDPWSQFGYAEWQETTAMAMDVRREWMRMMGIDDDEIAEHCRNSPPVDVDEELAEYNAMFTIQQQNAAPR